ncbi:hypothetical protein ACFL35_04090 [Candidatus Riflebacteria bacterium]
MEKVISFPQFLKKYIEKKAKDKKFYLICGAYNLESINYQQVHKLATDLLVNNFLAYSDYARLTFRGQYLLYDLFAKKHSSKKLRDPFNLIYFWEEKIKAQEENNANTEQLRNNRRFLSILKQIQQHGHHRQRKVE